MATFGNRATNPERARRLYAWAFTPYAFELLCEAWMAVYAGSSRRDFLEFILNYYSYAELAI